MNCKILKISDRHYGEKLYILYEDNLYNKATFLFCEDLNTFITTEASITKNIIYLFKYIVRSDELNDISKEVNIVAIYAPNLVKNNKKPQYLIAGSGANRVLNYYVSKDMILPIFNKIKDKDTCILDDSFIQTSLACSDYVNLEFLNRCLK